MNSDLNHDPVKPRLTMPEGALSQLHCFLHVADTLSFTAAARVLRVSTSAVSQAIARLEQELGAPLLLRTTRSVRLTQLGVRVARETRPLLSNLVEALASARAIGPQEETLRLNVPRVACRVGLPGLLKRYARLYPDRRVEVTVEERRVDIVRDGYHPAFARASRLPRTCSHSASLPRYVSSSWGRVSTFNAMVGRSIRASSDSMSA